MNIFDEVKSLYSLGITQKEIAYKLEISEPKVRKILVTLGEKETPESKLFDSGKSIDEICAIVGKKRSTVCSMIPYDKGIYSGENPTRNALRIRECRERRLKNGNQ